MWRKRVKVERAKVESRQSGSRQTGTRQTGTRQTERAKLAWHLYYVEDCSLSAQGYSGRLLIACLVWN